MHLEPYLVFGGHCEEALNFYKQVFNGEIEGISRWSEMPTGCRQDSRDAGDGEPGDACQL